MYLITKWFGTFIFDNKELKKKILFPNDEKEILKRLSKINNREILNEEKKIIKGIKDIKVNEKRLEKIGNYNFKDPIFKKINVNPKDFGFSTDLLQKASIKVTKNIVDEKLASEDLQIMQMVNALDDLIHTSNLLYERIDSWEQIPTDIKKIQPIKNVFSSVNIEIESIEKQIDEDMSQIAPNITKIIGPLIGARLISHAGGLQRLALMPSSTIQILGAEKALFRYKKEGGKPPKHGVIFQHPKINKAPRNYRGKIARIYATKLAIAVKADFFTKRNISNILQKDIENKIKELKDK